MARKKPTTVYDNDLEYYESAIVWLKKRLSLAVVELRQSRGEGFKEGFGGLFIADEEVDEILLSFLGGSGANEGIGKQSWSVRSLKTQWRRVDLKRGRSKGLKIDQLAAIYDLDELERFVLLLAFLPQVESRLGKVYAYLQDDVNQKSLTLALCRQLYPYRFEAAKWHKTLFTQAPLLKAPLLHSEVNQPQRMLQPIHCEDGICNYLLGFVYPDDELATRMNIVYPNSEAEAVVNQALEAISKMSQQLALSAWPLIGLSCDDSQQVTQALADTLQARVYWLTLKANDPQALFSRWLRDSWLHQAVPVLTLEEKWPSWVEQQDYGYILLVKSTLQTELVWPLKVQWALDWGCLSQQQQQRLWLKTLPDKVKGLAETENVIEQITEQFGFNHTSIEAINATLAYQLQWQSDQDPLGQLLTLCRHQASSPMVGLASHIESPFQWQDLVVSATIERQLQSFARSVRLSGSYIQQSNMQRVLGVSQGVCALFSGVSGTGKTMAAGVIANQLSLDLYRIDLSRVVSKYIGETEKNLDRIFHSAAQSRVILFFDEGDALFGKRSEVQDAHDRYANIEVSYLLQKIEAHPGTSIIATNFADNIDDAFARRIDHMVVFPMPSEAQRHGIWSRIKLLNVNLADDIDFNFLAAQFELTGGQIKNALLIGCFSAKALNRPVQMVDLVQAVAAELRKLKRPINRTMFGQYFNQIDKS